MENKDVWIVFGDKNDSSFEHVLQLVSKASALKKEHSKVCCVCFNGFTNNDFNGLACYGANTILLCDKKNIDHRNKSKIISEMIKRYSPELVIFPSNSFGKACSSYVSIAVGGGLTADCVDIKFDCNSGYLFKRSALGSSVLAQIACINTKLNLATVKNNVFEKQVINNSSNDLIIEKFDFKDELYKPSFKVLKTDVYDANNNNIDISTAKLIFGFGRAFKTKDDLNLLKQVCKKYNAEIVGSRGVVETGLIDRQRQVGQSGISISSLIYIALGISGASQHMVGLKNVKTIIAVNTDKNAPIFSFADYIFVEDYKDILLELL